MPTPGNSLNITSAGIVTFNGTSTFSADTVTQHYALVGGASNAITSVTPSTAGLVLTSNGTTLDPSFQAVPSSFSPNSTVQLFDEFVSGDNFATNQWHSNFAYFSNFGITAATENGHPGLWASAAIGGGQKTFIIYDGNGSAVGSFVLGGGLLTLNIIMNIVTLSGITGNRYTMRLGLGDTAGGGTDQVNGCYFEYSDNINSGNWVLKTSAASSRTTTNTAVAVATGWHNFQIQVNAAASSVNYTLDGVSLNNIATNIPSAAISFFIDIAQNLGSYSAGFVVLDLWYLNQALTSTR